MRGCSSIHAICIATCSLGEVCRVLKPHEKCSQNFRSLLGDSTQTMYSGEKKKTTTKQHHHQRKKTNKQKQQHLCSGEKKKKSVAIILDQTMEKFSLFWQLIVFVFLYQQLTLISSQEGGDK